MLIICFISFSFGALLFFLSGLMEEDRTMRGASCIMFVVGLLFAGMALLGLNALYSGSEYYLPCEVVAANETSTYFGTVDQDTQQIYAVETEGHIWPDDVPYLLHMDGKDTKTVTDDEVLMVWRAD